jgi:hypothetical protein
MKRISQKELQEVKALEEAFLLSVEKIVSRMAAGGEVEPGPLAVDPGGRRPTLIVPSGPSSGPPSEWAPKRYRLMLRLVSGEDEQFLIRHGLADQVGAARRLRLKLYRELVADLEAEVRLAMRARRAAMARAGDWDVQRLASTDWKFFQMRLRLHTAGWLYFLRMCRYSSAALCEGFRLGQTLAELEPAPR